MVCHYIKFKKIFYFILVICTKDANCILKCSNHNCKSPKIKKQKIKKQKTKNKKTKKQKNKKTKKQKQKQKQKQKKGGKFFLLLNGFYFSHVI